MPARKESKPSLIGFTYNRKLPVKLPGGYRLMVLARKYLYVTECDHFSHSKVTEKNLSISVKTTRQNKRQAYRL